MKQKTIRDAQIRLYVLQLSLKGETLLNKISCIYPTFLALMFFHRDIVILQSIKVYLKKKQHLQLTMCK